MACAYVIVFEPIWPELSEEVCPVEFIIYRQKKPKVVLGVE